MSSATQRLARKPAKGAPAKQVRLKLVYIDFWSAVKLSFLVSVALGIVLVVGVALVWMVLAQTGIFEKLSDLYSEISGQDFSIVETFGLGPVLGFVLVIALLNVVVGTALGAITTVLYNLSVRITGGVLVGFTNQ